MYYPSSDEVDGVNSLSRWSAVGPPSTLTLLLPGPSDTFLPPSAFILVDDTGSANWTLSKGKARIVLATFLRSCVLYKIIHGEPECRNDNQQGFHIIAPLAPPFDTTTEPIGFLTTSIPPLLDHAIVSLLHLNPVMTLRFQ